MKEKVDLILSTGDYAGIDDWRPLMKKMFKLREKGKKVCVSDILGEKGYEKLIERDYAAGKIPILGLNGFKVPVLSVFGNGDWYEEDSLNYSKLIKKLKYFNNINRASGKFEKLRITGFGGYVDNDVYFSDKGMKAIGDSNSERKERMKRYHEEEKELNFLMKIKPDIILSHYTPYKCLDKLKTNGLQLNGSHMGVKMFNRVIERYKPILFVCGHMHENQGKCKLGKTIVVNPGPAGEGKAAIIELDGKKVLNVRFLR